MRNEEKTKMQRRQIDGRRKTMACRIVFELKKDKSRQQSGGIVQNCDVGEELEKMLMAFMKMRASQLTSALHFARLSSLCK